MWLVGLVTMTLQLDSADSILRILLSGFYYANSIEWILSCEFQRENSIVCKIHYVQIPACEFQRENSINIGLVRQTKRRSQMFCSIVGGVRWCGYLSNKAWLAELFQIWPGWHRCPDVSFFYHADSVVRIFLCFPLCGFLFGLFCVYHRADFMYCTNPTEQTLLCVPLCGFLHADFVMQILSLCANFYRVNLNHRVHYHVLYCVLYRMLYRMQILLCRFPL